MAYEFKPFERVLVSGISEEWIPDFYGYAAPRADGKMLHYCISGTVLKDDEIVPYEGHEELYLTDDEPEQEWEPEEGELVAVSGAGEIWIPRIYAGKSTDGRYSCKGSDEGEAIPWDLCEPAWKHWHLTPKPGDNE